MRRKKRTVIVELRGEKNTKHWVDAMKISTLQSISGRK